MFEMVTHTVRINWKMAAGLDLAGIASDYARYNNISEVIEIDEFEFYDVIEFLALGKLRTKYRLSELDTPLPKSPPDGREFELDGNTGDIVVTLVWLVQS